MDTGLDQTPKHQSEQFSPLRVNVAELIADLRTSTALTSRLVSRGFALIDGFDVWSHDDMNILERVLIRGAREIRVRQLNALMHEISNFSDDFHSKAEMANTVLRDNGKSIPIAQKFLGGMVFDLNISTSNHNWPSNMQTTIHSLLDYLHDIDRLLKEYWVALERLSESH